MSDPTRYRSKAILREETLYYDMGYKFSELNGKKPKLAFTNDYIVVLLFATLAIQVILNVSQIFTILCIALVIVLKYSNSEKYKSPLFLILVVVAHVYDYYRSGYEAMPGQIIQDNLSSGFWFLETVWILILSYQILIIFQPVTPIIAKNQSVEPQTQEAKDNFKKMQLRLMGTGFTVDPMEKVINIDRLKQVLIDLLKIALVIMGIGIILDVVLWRIIFNLGGGTNIEEQYVITGMSLILLVLLVTFSNLIIPEADNEE